MTQTIGQKRVKADFNPEKNNLVDQIKNKAAELIDLCEQMRVAGSESHKIHGEKHRLISLAQTEFEMGAMWAVKANFTK